MAIKNMLLRRENVYLIFITCIVIIMASYPLTSFSFGIPSVGLCMEKTGLTEEQCQEKMKNFGNMSLQEKVEMKNELTGNAVKDNSIVIKNKIKEVQRIKTEKEKQFTQILEKVQKITDFLRSNNIDVSEIEKNTSIFNEKASNVIDAYEKHIELLKENLNAGMLTSDMAQETRRMIGRLTNELVVFSRTTLQENLRLQIRSISNN